MHHKKVFSLKAFLICQIIIKINDDMKDMTPLTLHLADRYEHVDGQKSFQVLLIMIDFVSILLPFIQTYNFPMNQISI